MREPFSLRKKSLHDEPPLNPVCEENKKESTKKRLQKRLKKRLKRQFGASRAASKFVCSTRVTWIHTTRGQLNEPNYEP